MLEPTSLLFVTASCLLFPYLRVKQTASATAYLKLKSDLSARIEACSPLDYGEYIQIHHALKILPTLPDSSINLCLVGQSHLLEYLTGYLYPKILATKSPVEGCLSVRMVTYAQEQLPPSI